ncbi:LysR family transcriptional regulator [Rhodospirillum rubrum]|uniref:LysR family transcriptional regulator n=1 Tax=Rhodospirillum rubrum TaxID=1085 RepID=UPI001907313E|nr:LysR family transcriptional regulator [Rhodospirillum rubrum]MBK1664084.1 LysR family transcriptional regulator [Rhodospirillum rubrum]MBK1676057.1 LysR family transcriptional regulator [Rhodospirillum rubrum]
MTPSDFAELRAFLFVADERSFRRAAKRLGVSPSALSRIIRSLEERLGARLLNRTTRSVAPTEAGQTLYERVAPTMQEMIAAMRDVRGEADTPKGTVRINLPSVAAHQVIAPKLGAFAAAYPAIRLDLVVENEMVDVVAAGFDVGVRTGEQVGRDMIAVRLSGDLRMAVVGSPEYFADHPPPRSPAELTDHRCLTYKWAKIGALMPWQFDGEKGRTTVSVDSVVTANDVDLLLSAALQGMGIAYLVETPALPHLASGALERVLDQWCRPVPGFHMYYSSRTRMPAVVRAFVDFMRLRDS